MENSVFIYTPSPKPVLFCGTEWKIPLHFSFFLSIESWDSMLFWTILSKWT